MKRILIIFALLAAFALPVQVAEANSFTSTSNLFDQLQIITGKNASYLPMLPGGNTKFDIAIMLANDETIDPFYGAGENKSGFNVLYQTTTSDFINNSIASITIDEIWVSAGNAVVYEYNGANVELTGGTIFVSALVGNVNYVFAFSPSVKGSFNSVPVPAAVILFGSGLAGIVALRRKMK